MRHTLTPAFLITLTAIGCSGSPDKQAESASAPAAQSSSASAAKSGPSESAKKNDSATAAAKSGSSAGANSSAGESAKSASSDKAADASKSTAGANATNASSAAKSSDASAKSADSLLALKTTTLDGNPVDLSSYKGKVALVVNVASECGFTPQYKGLEKLYEDLADKGFVILGFPSNDFGGQEPGTPQQIQKFCTDKYDVRFPLFAKVQTKAGPEQSPVYAYLKSATGNLPTWNFCKYLVGKDGKAIAFYPSKVTPEDPALRKAIETALADK